MSGSKKKWPRVTQGHSYKRDGLLSAYRRRQRRGQLPIGNGPKQRPFAGEGDFVPKGSLLYPGTSIPYAADRVNYDE